MPDPKLEWREAARADLLSIVDYISDDNPAAAQRLKDDIERKTGKLVEHPRLYKVGRVPGRAKCWCGRITWSSMPRTSGR